MIKALLRKMEPYFIGTAIHKTAVDAFNRRKLNVVKQGFEYRFITHYNENPSNLLSQLCDKYGSDKGEVKKSGHPYPWPSHTYTDFYARLFDHCRLDVRKVFECGLGTNDLSRSANMGIEGRPGASLRVWRDYFPNAQVYGADIDRKILFEEERIKTFYVDQTDPNEIDRLWRDIGSDEFDFMVDDGLHTFEGGVVLFENSINKLSVDGIYVIEDIYIRDMAAFKKYFANKSYHVDFVSLLRPDLQLKENSLIVIRR